jgi:hypothetical protein
MCDKAGAEIGVEGELLFRQVYPDWLGDDGEPSSQAFYPWRDVDDGCLSVDRGALISVERSFNLAVMPKPAGFALPSIGVWGLTVRDVRGVELKAWEDPVIGTTDHPANEAHAVIDFCPLDRKKWKSVGRRLKVKALDGKPLYLASASAPDGGVEQRPATESE